LERAVAKRKGLYEIRTRVDQIVVCTVDLLLPTDSPELSHQVKALKQSIRKWYRYYGSPQEEIWVIAHPILRQD
jgi:hypothetical protein